MSFFPGELRVQTPSQKTYSRNKFVSEGISTLGGKIRIYCRMCWHFVGSHLPQRSGCKSCADIEDDVLLRSGPGKPNPKKSRNKKKSWISFSLSSSDVVLGKTSPILNSHRNLVQICPREKFMNRPFLGLVCWNDSWHLLSLRGWSWSRMSLDSLFSETLSCLNGVMAPEILIQFFTPDFPQSEIAATSFYDSGGSLGEELAEELGEIFCAFSCFMCCTELPTNLLPKFLPIYHSISQESAKGAGGKGARVINCHNFFFTPDRETRRIDHTTTEGTAERKMRQFATLAPFTPAPFRPFWISCGRNLKISSARASGVSGLQNFISCNVEGHQCGGCARFSGRA